mmetsp:Transcript_23114/g.39427  ORF Transcript_23114/g.39427 Transcript_23114/m.39427 type:complete len:368 (-) Transcript_23114:370-1473(-)
MSVMSQKILNLHIGHYKTGTTALQSALYHNRRFLRQHGVDYCKILEDRSKHSLLAFSIFRAAGVHSLMHGYALKDTPDSLWQQLYSYVRKSRQQQIIVSTEEFARIGGIPQAALLLKDMINLAPSDIKIRVIAYVRPPQEHLKSWYNQLIKMGIKTPDFNTAVARFIEPVHFDYSCFLQPWIDACGAENVIVRRYPGFGTDGIAILRDFLQAIGKADVPVHSMALPDEVINPRVREETLELLRVMQNMDIDKNVIQWTEDRAHRYLAAQKQMVPDITRQFENVVHRSGRGLEILDQLPRSDVSQASLSEALPAADPDRFAEYADLQGFLLNEINTLRKRMNAEMADLYERVSALEQTLPKSAHASKK